MKAKTKDDLIKVVEAVGKSISENAANIVGDYEYGQGISINVVIGYDGVPSIMAQRNFVTRDIIDAIVNGKAEK